MPSVIQQLMAKKGITAPKPISYRNLDTTKGLYDLAVKSGLQKQADAALASNAGERTKEYFSGGFISDIFDVLNTFQYGVVGLAKGKSFAEGVKTRQSWADDDALGDKGIPGIIMGTILDIAMDPLTYIAPATVVKKFPVLGKLAKAGKEAVFGKMVTKTIEEEVSIASKAKTLEEFLKGQGEVLYHGTSAGSAANIEKSGFVVTKGGMNAGNGISLTPSKDIANVFGEGGQTIEAVLSKDAKLVNPREFIDTKNAFGEKGGFETATQKAIDFYKSKGYDGVDFRLGAGGIPDALKNEVRIWNPEVLTTKSQLTDIFNKAGKVLPEAGEAVARVTQAIPKTYQEIEGGTKIGRYMATKFSYMFGADPVFKNVMERSIGNIATTTDLVAGLTKTVSKIEPSTAAKLIERGADERWIRVPLDKIEGKIAPEQFEAVKTLYTKLDDLGKEAVDLKLLSEKQYKEGMGEYLKATYLEHELSKSKGFGFSKAGIPPIKRRKDLTLEQMKKLGQINDPAYLIFKSIFDLNKSVENAKMLRVIAARFGSKTLKNGMDVIPNTKKWGELAGMYVPKYMKDYLTEIVEPAEKTLGRTLVAGFKFSKVILNPATHVRNIISNKILNWWKLGMNPLDPRVIKTDATAMAELTRGGGKWMAEAKPLGFNLDTFAANELKHLLDSPETMTAISKAGSKGRKIVKSLGDIYQKEESWAKLSAYIFNRTTKNLNPEEAWKLAESATFNYAQVTPFVRKLRESMFGFPFITFTVKATPVALETAYKAPQRIGAIGKIKNNIEKLAGIEETDKERAVEPSWVKDGFYIKLPMKDSRGRSAYFDLTYILPFGDLVSGNFFERPQSTKTGLPESQAVALIKKAPFINLVSEIGKNKDFYGNSIWKESDSSEKQLGDLMRHITKTYVPPVVSDQIPGGYNDKGQRQQRGLVGAFTRAEDKESQQRTVMQELLRNVGMKIQPIDADIQETYQEWNRKKALQLLLLENGVLSNFNRVYVPKKK